MSPLDRSQNDPAFPFRISETVFEVRKIPLPMTPLAHLVIVRDGACASRSIENGALLPPDSLFYLPPGAACDIETVSRIVVTDIQFGERFIDDIRMRLWTDKLPPFVFNTPHRISLNTAAFQTLCAAALSMSDEYQSAKPGYRAMLQLKTAELFIRMQREVFAELPKPVKPVRIEEIVEEMKTRFFDEFDLNVMASRAGIAPASFSRAFKDIAGMPPFEYLNHLRIQHACVLLKKTEKPILDIAYDVGYNNLSFFNRYFRKITNMAPREYRDAVRK